ncbi:nuclear transport factor 2 family protein [Amycolatopsis magusensis]|uniref:nuclear transport factor 2 family protein n=1 Tax=Amycolatopsis magusensis TaxID=882444 RepID=UPI0024A93F46|nr:nuclear transport factor 2 family protein [Amycolatopsis magusensis]MDI5975304.1 nuclear transport factor 2 family protein [Amycolatopsis magusensis]
MSEQIRTLIEQWATAVHQCDLDGVLAGHTEDVVMFDVPELQQGVRGIAAYRETWPAFFDWQANGAIFEIESLEITAGEDVAYAFALLRCGMPDDLGDQRLRLTFGLRRESGRWLIAHEHHSFPLSTDGEPRVREIHEEWFDGTSRKDLDGLMSHIAEDVVSYEHEAPLQVTGVAAVRDACRTGLEQSTGAVEWHVPDLRVLAGDDLAVAWGINHLRAELPDGTFTESRSRGTRIFQRRHGQWQMVHQHVSFPYDPATGQAQTGSEA